MRAYAVNCFWLMVPVLLINAALGERLPQALQPAVFWTDIPCWIAWPENLFRLLVVGLPAFMPLGLTSSRKQLGLVFYALGLVAYSASWLALVAYPASDWSQSAFGLVAPAANRYFPSIKLPNWLFPAVACAFLLAHNAHTFMVVALR